MAKMFKKLLATALSLALLATLCAVPMSVSAEETYEAYDVVTYEDLLDNVNRYPLAEEGVEITTKNTLFYYDVTSETHSVIYKFRLVLGSVTYFQMYPGEYGEDPFQYRINVADDQWVKRYAPANETKSIGYDIKEGDEFDIEIARLKVATGENAGKYLTYFKVDGKDIFGKIYVSESQITDISIRDSIQFATNSEGASYTIKATPEPEEETYDAYDEVTFDKLKGSGNTFTYDATSSSFSSIIKFRWTAGGDQKKFTLFLDDWVYPFCFAAKTPNQSDFGAAAGENGAWHLVPSNGGHIVQMDKPVADGEIFDIEVARLKVLTGENKGKYYVYAKVNGELIKDYYFDGVTAEGIYGNGTALSNKVIISVPAGNTIGEIPVPEEYDAYDEITFDDLYLGNTSMSGATKDDGNHTYTYNATSASFSTKFAFRWIAGSEQPGFTAYFDDWVFPFCFCAKYPNRGDFGAAAGANGAWHLEPSKSDNIVQMDKPAKVGDAYDIELGRLKVTTGKNTGKYYVYAKVNGELIKYYYYDGVVDGKYGNNVALSNKIIIASTAGNKFTATPIPVTYEEYDEIGFEDLRDANGNSLGDKKQMSGATVFTYEQKSATASAIFKFNWKIGEKAKFQMSFDKSANDAMSYMFGAWLAAPGEEANFPNGRMWLRPAFGPQIKLEEALAPGSSHDIEFARLKVKTGSNAGKYYVYIKIDDVLIGESYVDANVVDANGNYTSNGTTVSLSNEIFFAFWGSNGNYLTSYGNVIEDKKGDFDFNGAVDATELVTVKKAVFGSLILDDKNSAIADFNNDGKVDILDLIAIKNVLVA